MRKHYSNILRGLTLGFVVVMALGLTYLSIERETVTDNKPYPATPAAVPSDCWTGGEGHPYPTRVKYNGEMRGQKVVDSLIKEMFEDRPGPYNPDLVSYFCK